MDMREIAQLNSANLEQLSAKQHQGADVAELGQRQREAMQQISEQNKLAAVDSLEFSASQQAGGHFSFSFAGQASASWQSGAQPQFAPPASFQSQFSFGFSVSSSMSVEFNQGISFDEQQMSGPDFKFNRDGLLELLKELIEKLGAQDRSQIDLGGELDGRALDLLEKLGLVDGEGRATQLLQALSDYAGLNRFQAGQQVRVEAGFSYSARYSQSQLSWQGWHTGATAGTPDGDGASDGNQGGADTDSGNKVTSGIGGANVVSDNQIGGDVNIDDRDVININIHNKGE